ncbi:unnamed protein product [Litomosoides sigmodontis]|uniref:Globin domain-containing protein n=1 Tax=Litomosoides sigmodontis TaxID=42156 RepID=A0A3P6V7F2_LITSI|nr:unnamed protein product [Litomosoides sigmodontis]
MYRLIYWNKINDETNEVKRSLNREQNDCDDFIITQVKKFSTEDRKSLQKTFNLFEKDLASIGLRIFLETLSENPEYKFFWPQFRAIPDSSLISSVVLRNFARTYMNALKKIVESLSKNEVPHEVLQRIAMKHARHNIQMFHIEKMIKPLLGNVRRALGQRDERVEETWKKLFRTIGTIIDYYKTHS